MTSLTLNIKVDFPPFNGSVTVKGDATMATFIEATCKESKMEKAVLQRYNMVAASYKTDVIELSHQAKSIEGLQTGHTVFFAAPGDLKPAVSLRKKKKAKDGEDKDLTDDKFAGLTPSSVLSKLMGQVTPKQQKLYIEYIGENFEDMNRQSLLKLPQDKMLAILSSDSLGVESEGVAFSLAMDWAKQKLKNESKTSSPDAIKTAVGPLLPAIRFPCMNSTDMASLVMPAGILDSQVILDLFTHIGKTAERKGDDDKPPKLEGSLKGMNGKPRSGSTGGIANYIGDFRTNSGSSYYEGKRWIIYINKKKVPCVYTDYLPWSSVYTTMHGITGYRITNGKVEKDMITLNDGGCDYTLRFDKSQSKGKDVVLAGTWFSTQGNGSGTMTLRRTDKKIPDGHKQFLGVEK